MGVGYMIVKSKYNGYGQVEIKETGHDYDFIAYIEILSSVLIASFGVFSVNEEI